MNSPQLADSELVSRLQELIASGKFNHSGLQPEIAESWERSYASSVDRYDGNHLYVDPLDDENLKHFELQDIARPAMLNMYKLTKGSGFQVLLTDERGLVIEHLPPADSLFFNNWNEAILGTNAIGTSLKIKKAIQITGALHYRQELCCLTSSAVPIYDQQGSVIAVLALIGPKCEDHSRVLSMLYKAVKSIVYRWRMYQQNRQLLTYNTHLRNIINIMTDGIIIFNDTGIIEQSNPAAARILGKERQDLFGADLSAILGEQVLLDKMLNAGTPFTDVELFFDSPTGRVHCLASGQSSRDDKGNISGGIIVLRSIDKVHRMVNRVYGTRAELNFNDIIGSSNTIKATIDIARIASNNISNILLDGESGTGKEIFARAIHNESSRHKGPFVAINCGAIPRELVGSELFGYVDGAFTGARRGGKPGKFEMAAGGTLFLDEIGDMPLEQQVVLLRVLQEKLVARIGDSKEIPVDVRVICATNKDLLQEVEKGNFRQDLYYRLNVILITIPPLRDRIEDLSLLINNCLENLGKHSTVSNLMNTSVMQYLSSYYWPGNVRELQNVVERLAIIADTRSITIADLPQEIRTCKNTIPNQEQRVCSVKSLQESYTNKKKQLIAEQETEQILTMLKKMHGNLSEVAKAMGFSRTTLYRKLQVYNISKDSW